jgi:membrane protein YfhO
MNHLFSRRDYLFLFFTLAMVLWFGHEIVWGGKLPFFRDLGTYFYPMRFSLAESFKAGELPLWDRHAAMGFPLLADFQSGTFYPPHLLFRLLPFFSALSAVLLFHYIVAATGAYSLCRHWNYSPYISLLGAIFFTFGGTIVSLTNLLNHFQTAVWLPWALLFGERCLKSQSWKSFLALAFTLLLQFLAGSPEIYAMSVALLFLDGLRLRTDNKDVTYRKVFFLFGAANILVIGLAMVQILPTIELIRESRARRSIDFAETTAWSLHPLQLIDLFFPDKEVDTAKLPPLIPFFIPKIPFLVSHYLGALAPLSISFWFYYVSRKEKILLSALICLSLLIAAGGYTPLYPALLRYVPFFSLFRFPEKFFFLTYALLIFVVLKGVSCFLNSDRSSRLPLLSAASIFLFFFLVYIYSRLDSTPLVRFIVWARGNGGLRTSALATFTLVLARLEVQLALTFGLLVLLVGKKCGLLRESLFNVLLIAVVFVDLSSAHQPLQYLIKPDFVTNSRRVLDAPDSEPARLFYTPGGSNLHPSDYYFSREPSFSEFNALVFDNLLPNAGVFYGFDYMQEIDALGRWPYDAFLYFANRLSPEPLYRMLGVLNVKYVISFKPLEKSALVLVRQFPEYPSWLYRIEQVVPRIYIVNQSIEETDPFKVMERLSKENFRPLQEVVLDRKVNIVPKEPFHGEAKIEEYKNQTVTIHAALNGAGILILADSFYPGWRVYVDGIEKEIVRANLFFRAVKLEAGGHRVEFRYEPRSFRLGLMISLAGFGAVLLVSGVLFYKRKKRDLAVT